MNLSERISRLVSTEQKSRETFVSLKQICLFLKKQHPDAGWNEIARAFCQELNSLATELSFYSFSHGILTDVALDNALIRNEKNSRPRSFEEMGQFIEISAQGLLSDFDNRGINRPEFEKYGFKKADLVNHFGSDFTEQTPHQENPPAQQELFDEIAVLKAEIAHLKKISAKPHPNAERHSSKREQVLRAALYLLYGGATLWQKKRKTGAEQPELPNATRLAALIEKQGIALWETGAPPLTHDSVVRLIAEAIKLPPKEMKK